MKLFYKYSVVVLAAILSLASCTMHRDKTTINPELIKPATFLSFPTSTITLDKDQPDGVQIIFGWTGASYSYPASILYTIEAYQDDIVLELGQTNNTSISIQTKVINSIVTDGFGVAPGDLATFDVRLISSIGVDKYDTISAPVSINVIPYSGAATPLYMIGEYNGWDHSKDVAIYSETSNGIYLGWVYMNVSGKAQDDEIKFLFTPAQNWDNKYGSVGGNLAELVKDGGDDIAIGNGYLYQLEADTKALVGSIKQKATTFGIIGGFNGWSQSEDLTYNPNNKLFELASITISNGDGFKFRCDSNWTIQWGAGEKWGEMKSDGGDIIFEGDSGTYMLSVNLFSVIPTFTFTPAN